MKVLLILILSVLLTGCIISEPAHTKLKNDYYSALDKIENQKKIIRDLQSPLQKIYIENAQKEEAAAAYLMCSFPVNFCPESVEQAGRKAIAAGASGGTVEEVWIARLLFSFAIFTIVCLGIYPLMQLHLMFIAPKKAEVESSKKLIAESNEQAALIVKNATDRAEEVQRKQEEKKQRVNDETKQTNKNLNDLRSSASLEKQALEAIKKEIASSKDELETIKNEVKKMQMIREAIRSTK